MSDQEKIIVNGVEINGSMPEGFDLGHFLEWVEQYRPTRHRVNQPFKFRVPVSVRNNSFLLEFSNPDEKISFKPIGPKDRLIFGADGDVHFTGEPQLISNR